MYDDKPIPDHSNLVKELNSILDSMDLEKPMILYYAPKKLSLEVYEFIDLLKTFTNGVDKNLYKFYSQKERTSNGTVKIKRVFTDKMDLHVFEFERIKNKYKININAKSRVCNITSHIDIYKPEIKYEYTEDEEDLDEEVNTLYYKHGRIIDKFLTYLKEEMKKDEFSEKNNFNFVK